MLSWLITENVEQWTLTLVLKRQDIALFISFLIKQKKRPIHFVIYYKQLHLF